MKRYIYIGNSLKQTVSTEHKTLYPYYPDAGLVEAINLALLLKRPLLLMGEPGCGKTRLAEAVAYEFYQEAYQKHYVEWRIKSTTKAQEGLYRYDALRKLYDVQTGAKEEVINNNKLGNEKSYFQRGELAEAFHKSVEGNPCILLIDEIDKADIDFPNDLLNELEKYNFKVIETGEEVQTPAEKPLVIITSNKEKELPPAFLRRCIYYYIDFPTQGDLQKIVNAKFPDGSALVKDKAIYTFQYIRQATENNEKSVSTSELLDWVEALLEYAKNDDFKQAIEDWTRDWNNPTEEEQKDWEREAFRQKIGEIPYAQVLFKDEVTWRRFKKK